MSIDTIDRLLNVISRVNLLAPDQVEEVARELCPHYEDPLALADYLVQIEWLTEFQRDTLFDGNPSELSVGPYQLLSPLGEGGVGQVFKAWDGDKGRIVALKILRRDVGSRSDAVRQFNREREAVTRLSHPNIIKTYDADQVGNIHYFAMEYLEGVDLQHYVAEAGPLPTEQGCDFIRQTAQGLQHAHLLGLVHRDIKPANLLLIHAPVPARQPVSNGITPYRRSPDPIVKILDWGLARIKADKDGSREAMRGTTESEKGMLIGTADYVAPEQARDPDLVDTRADIYSLGCTLFYLLTGQPPFPGHSLMHKLLQHQEKEPPSVRRIRSDVPEEVDTVVRRMLAKRVEDRFQIPLLVVAALRPFCLGAMATAGSVIRPSSSANLSSVLRPGSSLGLPGGGPSGSFPRTQPGSNGTKH